MVILYQLNLCQLFYKLLKQPNYFGRFWQFMRRTRQSLMVHEGAKLNNFNAVCLIIVAHEGAKFNEPGDGLTNQLCRRHSAFVRGENLRGLKTLPLSIQTALSRERKVVNFGNRKNDRGTSINNV